MGHDSSGRRRTPLLILVASVAVLAGALLGAAVATAATGQNAVWSAAGTSGALTGAAVVPANGFPTAAITSTGTSLATPSGTSAFLGTGTPLGAVYGTATGYASLTPAAGNAPSVTTLTFARPTPASGWAFALGDVDAEQLVITATGPGGVPIPPSALGFQGTFNYCVNTPKPSSCAGPGPFTAVPTWDPATGTLTGNGVDSAGATGWFQASVPVSSLTIRLTRLVGSPVVQLWLTALTVPITGTVAGLSPTLPIASPVMVGLLETDGDPVLDPASSAPVVAAVAADGSFVIPNVAAGDYLLEIVPPPGVTLAGPRRIAVTVDVTLAAVSIPAGTFRVSVPLPVTGVALLPLLLAGSVLLAAGALLVRRTRRPPNRRAT